MEITESAAPGSRFPLESAQDLDVGTNSLRTYVLSSNDHFVLDIQTRNDGSKFAELVLETPLDREQQKTHQMVLTAVDGGTPERSGTALITITVLDANDNVPVFDKSVYRPSYTVYVTENNAPGASICSVTAFDPDSNQNAYLSYSILEDQIQGMPVSTYVSINSDNGNIYALRSFDYEQLRNFQIRVQAQDAGFPPLSSNVTVNVFVLDQNDNAPVIVSPLPKNGTVATEMVPRSVDAGYLVAKITAIDADAGQNSRLSYQVLQATDPGLFSVALYTGEIRTIRRFVDKDATRQRLVILVKDNGQPSLSATVSIILSVVDSVPESLSDFGDLTLSPQSPSNLPLYLIVSLSTISFIFLVAIIVLAAIKCYKDRDSIQGYSFSFGDCCAFQPEPPTEVFKKSNLNLQISSGTKVPTNCVEANSNGPLSQAYCYKVCLTPESAKSDFMFLKPCSPTTPRNNVKGTDNLVSAWSAQNRSGTVNNGATTPNELKQPNMDWPLSKMQNTTLKSYSSMNMDGTLIRKAMHTDPENFGPPMAGQYWTWGTHMRDYKMSSPSPGVPNRSWTPRYAPQHSTRPPPDYQHNVYMPATPAARPPPDYQHNVYIPGTPTAHCTLRPMYRSDLDVKNSFSTFGKKRRFISGYDPKEDAVINNDLFNK
ncbi:hypothetical protein ANANG_G00070180 [Anguilla anguilla]|uniref:Cadherin domain-containing protein n=1 Tax=Anguilla anguilla TaxID=7936 RepID=A0A9D3S602_ANGAN|nr:hypothetical protein ANANG_G00070180 [Anguilla anguilla]